MDQALQGLQAQPPAMGEPPALSPPTLGAPPAVTPSVASPPAVDAPAAQYDAHLHKFTHEAIADFQAGKISRDDLAKAVSYSGLEPYATWKHQNVERLKALHKHVEKQQKERAQ